jgi:predicted MFS family arabinose efflux permease
MDIATLDTLTVSLAQFIGPVMLAVGLGIFVSRNYYEKVYRHLEQETLAVLMSGIIALVVGIAIVLSHNYWHSLLAGIVSLVGWLSITKGLLLIIAPRTVDRIGDSMSSKKGWFTFAAILYTAIGVYVSYMAYMFYALS